MIGTDGRSAGILGVLVRFRFVIFNAVTGLKRRFRLCNKKSRWYLVHVSCSVSGQKYLFDEYQVSSERVAWASLRHT